MKIFLKIILGIVFIPLFLIFLILTAFRFQILNYDYLTNSFERNNIYKNVDSFQQAVLLEQEKKGNGGELEINITPELAKDLIEKNLKYSLEFINGQTENFYVYFPPQGQMELTKIAPNFPKDQLENINKVGNFVLIGWIISLVSLLGIIIFRLLHPIYLISIGAVFALLGILIRFFLIQMSRDLVKPGGSEPSQVLLGMMASSILPEVANLWIGLSIILLLLGVGLMIYKKIKV